MKKAKVLSLLLAGSLLFHTAGIDALATAASDPVFVSESAEEPEEESSEESDLTENEEKEVETEGNSEEGKAPEDRDDSEEGKESEDGDASEGEKDSEEENNSEDGDVSEEKEDLESEENSEDTISANTISENTLPEEEEDAFAIFPGLGDNYTMSSQQLANKRELAAHVGDIVAKNTRSAEDYPDVVGIYELGEVVYLAETEAEAKEVAEAFGGTLDSYSYEVAVISLPEQATVAMAIAAAAEPDLKLPAVWPNYYNYLDSDINAATAYTPSDPGFAEQWQHDYIGTSYAWAAGFKGNGIKVAVIDSGIQKNHTDLNDNVDSVYNFVDASTPNYNQDNGSHGTHVAGIIAAANNKAGGVGIAPEATVTGYCVFPKGEDSSAETSDIIRAINAAAETGADIINMSLGGPMYHGFYAETVQEAYKKGVAIFASSGNDDTNANNFPAAYPGTISVGAVDQNSARASFSNYGGTVNLSFPGVHIYSTVPTNTYGYMSGTSQASPAAAGTAAVILSAREDIRKKSGKARVDALLSAMKSSTTKCTSSGMGAGTTWLPGVLKIATDMTAPDAPTITIAETASDKAGKTYIAKEVTATLSTETAVGVEIYYTTDGKSPSYKNGQIVVGQKYTGAFKVDGAKNKTIKAITVNPITGKVSKVASKACVLTPIPEGVTVTAANGVSKITVSKSVKLTATVTPSYAISNKVDWTVADAEGNDAKAKGVTVSNGTVKAARNATAGTYTVKATAVGTDGKTFNNGKFGTYEVTVLAISDIKTVAFIDGATGKAVKAQNLNTQKTLDLRNYLVVTKTDNSQLKEAAAAAEVVWSSSNTKVATVANGVITAEAPGKAVIKAISNDGGNKSASFNVTVTQAVMEITLSGPQTVAAGKSITLTATVTPNNATNKKLDWKVEDNDKVTVSASGKVSAKKDAKGTCTVTAAAKDGSGMKSAGYTVNIVSGEITSITLSSKTLTLFAPQTVTKADLKEATLTADIKGKEGMDKSLITWTSSAPSIASVNSDGKVTAKSAGKATITCASTDGSNKKATCTVNVTIPMSKLAIGPADSYGDYYDDLTEAKIGKTEGYLGYIASGKSIKMSAKYSSNYGTPTNKKVIWKSSNENVLSVDKNGKVTANGTAKIGAYATITATAADGSNVVSNEYNFIVTRFYRACAIDDDLEVITATGERNEDGDLLIFCPSYYTVSVSGGKNPGLKKKWDDIYKCYQLFPIPGNVTSSQDSDTPANKLTGKDKIKMTITVKLRDGSGLSAKKSIYAARFSDGTIRYFW